MITPKEFVARWRNANDLITYDAAIVNALNIPAASKEFLLEAGLPRLTKNAYCFDIPPNNLPRLSEAPEPYRFSEAYNHLRLLGETHIPPSLGLDSLQILFCIDERNRGQIVEVYSNNFVHDIASKEYPRVTLLNSSVVHLAEVLFLLEEHSRWFIDHDVKTVGHDIFEAHCEDMARRLEAVDPHTLQTQEEWENEEGDRGWTELINLIRIGEG